MSFGNDLLVCFDRISGRMISEMKLLIREKKGISIIQRYVSKSDNTSYTQMTRKLYRCEECELSDNMPITHPTRKHCRTTDFFSVIYGCGKILIKSGYLSGRFISILWVLLVLSNKDYKE